MKDVLVRKVPTPVLPPLSLIQQETEPVFFGTKNEDLLFYIDDLRAWGGACQIDKQSLESWAEQQSTTSK